MKIAKETNSPGQNSVDAGQSRTFTQMSPFERKQFLTRRKSLSIPLALQITVERI